MSNIQAIESALISNDLSKLNPEERLSYYNKVCESLGLNPLTQPFAYITLNGKLTLYAKRDCTDQLRKVHKVSINITDRQTIEGVYVVTAKARDVTGREDESTGAVTITNLKGDALANAFLKAETKAKRRVTLSICGLGLLDETEVETIPTIPQAQAQAVAVKEIPHESRPANQTVSTSNTPKPRESFVRNEEQAPWPSAQDRPPEEESEERQVPRYPEDFVIEIGKKYAGKRLCEVEVDQLKSFVEWLENKNNGKSFPASTAMFIEAAHLYISKNQGLFADDIDADLKEKK